MERRPDGDESKLSKGVPKFLGSGVNELHVGHSTLPGTTRRFAEHGCIGIYGSHGIEVVCQSQRNRSGARAQIEQLAAAVKLEQLGERWRKVGTMSRTVTRVVPGGAFEECHVRVTRLS